MKSYRYIYFFALFLAFICKGWAQNTSRDELQFVVEKIENVVTQKKDVYSKCPMIAIGGCPGSGKTTLACFLQQELYKRNIRAKVIHFSHFVKNSKERTLRNGEINPERIAWNVLRDTLQSIRSKKKKIIKPVIHQLTKERGKETLDLQNIDCIIFEGSYALSNHLLMNVLQYADLAFYIETPLENIYDWKWERENKKSKPRKEESFFQHMMYIVQDFALYVYPTRKNAHYILQKDPFHNFKIIKGQDLNNKNPDFKSIQLKDIVFLQ